MDGGRLVDAAYSQSLPEGDLQGVDSYVALFVGIKKLRALAKLTVVYPQKLLGRFVQRYIAVFAAFAVTYSEEISLAVNVACRKPHPFGNAQAAGIDDGERHPVERTFNLLQNGADFIL